MENDVKHPELSGEQKARLLRLGLDSEDTAGAIGAEDRKAHLLFDVLATPLPVDPALIDSLPAILKPLCRQLKSVAGEPLGKLLQDPQVGLSVLERIKEYAKELGGSTKSQVERDVALVIYYAAIAGALLHHDKRITQYSYADLKDSFEALSKQTWIPQDLTEMFTRAFEHCKEKAG